MKSKIIEKNKGDNVKTTEDKKNNSNQLFMNIPEELPPKPPGNQIFKTDSTTGEYINETEDLIISEKERLTYYNNDKDSGSEPLRTNDKANKYKRIKEALNTKEKPKIRNISNAKLLAALIIILMYWHFCLMGLTQ